MVTVPLSLKEAFMPAALNPSNKSPSVLVEFKVIVDVSLLEFLTTTVEPFVILSSDKSLRRLSNVASVTCVTTVSYVKSPLCCIFVLTSSVIPRASIKSVVPSFVITAFSILNTPFSSSDAVILLSCKSSINDPRVVVSSTFIVYVVSFASTVTVPAFTPKSAIRFVSSVATTLWVMVSFNESPITFPVRGFETKPNAEATSYVPPVISPPDIITVPSSLIAAFNPAALNPSNKSPSVLVEFKVITDVSLLEFLTITVAPFVSFSSDISVSNVSSVASVTCVTTVLYTKSPLCCVFLLASCVRPKVSIKSVVPSFVITASSILNTPFSSMEALIFLFSKS